jgi:hypothetical protein
METRVCLDMDLRHNSDMDTEHHRRRLMVLAPRM